MAGKYLYHRNKLYNIIKEHESTYHVERFNKVSINTHLTPINFKPESANNYHIFGRYTEKGILNIPGKLFKKSHKDYLIIDKFDILNNTLIIINDNNILNWLTVCNIDFDNYKYYYKMKHITDNIRAVKAKERDRLYANGGWSSNEEIDLMYSNTRLNHRTEYANMLEEIETLPNKEYIHGFLKYNADFEPVSDPPPPIISDSDSDSDNDDFSSFINSMPSEEDKPILTDQQQEKILL